MASFANHTRSTYGITGYSLLSTLAVRRATVLSFVTLILIVLNRTRINKHAPMHSAMNEINVPT